MQFYAILLIILFVVLVCYLVFIFVRLILRGQRESRILQSGRHVTATVTKVGEYNERALGYRPRGLGPKRYYVIATWRDEETSEAYTFQKRGLFNAPRYNEGDTIQVTIAPNNPQQYVMQVSSN